MLTVFRSQVDPEELVCPVPQVVDCSGDPDICRQEQKADADVNRVIGRYYASGRLPDVKEGQAGAVDYDLDLLGAMGLREQVRAAHASLTDKQKEKYPSPEAMITAALQMDLDLSDPDPKRRVGDAPRGRRSEDKAAEETARFNRAVDEAAAKRSAAGG